MKRIVQTILGFSFIAGLSLPAQANALIPKPEFFACTEDARLSCVNDPNLGPQPVYFGRIGPNCEFPRLPNEVPVWECEGVTPPFQEIICTLDAMSLCVKDKRGKFQSIEVGRTGPSCSFPRLDSEVHPRNCVTDPNALTK